MTIIRTKRSVAPGFWRIPRKGKRFVVTPSSGPHTRVESYPLAILLRDILRLARTYRETKVALHDGKILVDGVIRRDPHFSVGLMDIIEITALGKCYRIIPSKGSLVPLEIPDSERDVKICRIRGKRIVSGGAVQYALHDGRNLLARDLRDLKPGDSLLIQVPSQKMLNHIRFQPGSLGLISKGQMGGRVGKIATVRQATLSRPSMTELKFDSEMIEIPSDLVLPVGVDKPLVKVEVG